MSQKMFQSALPKVAIAALLFTSSLFYGQIPSKLTSVKTSPTSATATVDRHELTAEDLGAFLDGIVPLQLHRDNIAGAVVLVVKDGKVLYEHGYGYADVDKKTPISPGDILRPGSVSKLFTWTAVMQLVEQGKINLDENVNTYLDFKVPETFARPITMRNLMTHTAGFEESIKNLIIQPRSEVPPLRQYLVTHMPARVYVPGTTPAYSNYGATLAGYIVQRVSGIPFDDYVETNIFAPLGMMHSTFRQPLPAALQPMMSDGYALASDEAMPFELISDVPAGSSSVSAEDISHFMLAHLQQGQYLGARILSPATIALMHSPQFATHPLLPHMCMGFYEETRNGHRIIGHGGDTQWFHSDLHLMQDENLGFFVSYNSAGRGKTDVRSELFQSFLNRYFPYSVPPVPPQHSAVQDAKLVAGEYIQSRRSVTNILSFSGFLKELSVTAEKDGTIRVDTLRGVNELPRRWIEIGPLLYSEQNGQSLMAFTRDSQNRLVLSTYSPYEVATKVALADNKIWNYCVLAFIAIVSLGTLLSWPISALLRRHYQRPLMLSKQQKRLRFAIHMAAAFEAIFMSCWIGLLLSGEPLFEAHLDPVLRLFQVIGWFGVLNAFVALYAVVKNWRSPGECWLSRIGNALVAITTVSFLWFVLHWHLLHFNLAY